MAKYTPMMEQYLSIKKEVPDAFLFFRLGDFYELFFEDALKAASELEITLTGRDAGAEERVPMCGVPYHSADQYIARLIQKGYKVAICEQMEDPAQAKGVVRREIVRIVTPGTVMEGKSLGDAANNFAVTITGSDGTSYSLASCDLTTGELYVTSMHPTLASILEEAAVYQPAEIVLPPELADEVRRRTAQWPHPVAISPWENAEFALLAEHFGQARVDRLSPGEKACVALLLSYLHATQKRSLSHISDIRQYESKQYMTLDLFTRRNLELTESARDRSRKGSLLWLLDRTVTAMGARRLRRWVDKPLVRKAEIEARLEAVDALYRQLIVREDLREHLKQVYDLERIAGKIAYGSANARDLVALKTSLSRVPAAIEACRASGSATLREQADRIDPCADIMQWIEAAIVDDPPVSVREGGMIRTGYHERLDRLREANINGKQWIAELERTEREKTGIKSLKIGFNKVFGYYIEVTRANLAALPEGRYERKQTLANAERFVTPELKEKEALILEAEEKMVELEYELFAELRERIAGELRRLQELAEFLSVVDALQSLATVAAANHYVRPQITEGFDLRIEEGRHPVVEAVQPDQSFVANDTMLSRDRCVMLITGPNMAGKSTYMRQTALIVIMAHIGSFVPARSAQVPIVDRIFTRIGAADDLIGGQSTFMMEMQDIRVMTEHATEKSLVIIDELGRGTSTGEGMAIAQAVIEYLHDRIGCKTLVSTHFHELAHLEDSLTHLHNYCMAVKESGTDVVFLRKLVTGAASTSYGIYCARLAGLPAGIIDRAYGLLNAFEQGVSARSQNGAAAQAGGGWEEVGGTTGAGDRFAKDASGSAGTGDSFGSDGSRPIGRGGSNGEGGDVHGSGESSATAYFSDEAPENGTADSLLAARETAAALASSAAQSVQSEVPVQLSLFAEEEERQATARKKADAKALRVAEQIRALDLMSMTPLQAMNVLYELKQTLTKSGRGS